AARLADRCGRRAASHAVRAEPFDPQTRTAARHRDLASRRTAAAPDAGGTLSTRRGPARAAATGACRGADQGIRQGSARYAAHRHGVPPLLPVAAENRLALSGEVAGRG